MPSNTKTKTSAVVQMIITLTGISPAIWRRVVVSENLTLHQLHKVIQRAMGWTDSHLHEFWISKSRYGSPQGDTEIINEQRVLLSELNLKKGQKFRYIYDFGDDWQHEIRVEKVVEGDNDDKGPVCLGGKRACPPEDCGGPWGYMNLLSIMQDPKHPEYQEMLDWLGDELNSEQFDLAKINQRLQSIERKPKKS